MEPGEPEITGVWIDEFSDLSDIAFEEIMQGLKVRFPHRMVCLADVIAAEREAFEPAPQWWIVPAGPVIADGEP